MSRTTPISGPHTHNDASVTRIMGTVILALVPATFYGIYIYGWASLFLFLVTLISAVIFEVTCLYLGKRPIKPALIDLSGILSAWLVALTLPPWAPWWIGVMGAACAIILGKQVFGGLGQNVFNPAMLARVILLISFPVQMTTWVAPQPMFSEQDQGIAVGFATTFSGDANWDAVTTASPLGHVKTELTLDRAPDEILSELPSYTDMALGNIAGSMGETSALLILLGGIFLLLKGIISWHAPVALLATVGLLATGFHYNDPTHFAPPQFHLLNGALMLAAFFIITDPVTSPSTAKGQIIFGIGCGFFIYVIRTWGSYPEAVGFAVLLMNSVTPLIDYYLRPRVYGRTRSGQPIAVKEARIEETGSGEKS